MTINNFRDLDAWKVAMELALRVYEVIERLPQNERFEMASPMRRAALSVPSNVAEGHACKLRRRYRFHVRVALGSVAELVTCIELGFRLGYWNEATAKRMDGELVRMSQLLNGVLRSIQRQLAVEGLTVLAVLCVALFGL
jgi:four helix bundle protein